MKTKRASTIVEFILALTILAMLAALIIPAITKKRQNPKELIITQPENYYDYYIYSTWLGHHKYYSKRNSACPLTHAADCPCFIKLEKNEK